jgi:hypothetical protein
MSDKVIETNFDVLMPVPTEVVVYTRKETLGVMPIQLTQVARVIRECAPLIQKLQALKTTTDLNQQTITDLILDNLDKLPGMLGACLDKPPSYFAGNGADVPALQLDEYMALTTAVFEKNVDFFIRRFLPYASQAGALLAGRLRPPVRNIGATKPTAQPRKTKGSSGDGPSKPSSEQGTATTT